MRKSIYTSALLMLFVILTSNTFDSGNSTDARINTYKQECKLAIKPARYDGARVTFYAPSSDKQTKNIETFFVLDTEYKLAFSGKECSTKINARIYNSNDESKRVLLKEIKNIQGKNLVVSSNDLTKVYKKQVTTNERLKSIFIEYEISSGNQKNEAIVLVVGYMD